ncbi:hypothetical protein UY3_08564 [Chelonia mydas]|uniref:Uncharacterized protein n=1 Tax=Chelonia mydas TaxID=8469 RepID=M7BAT7_CHEMY|nr:hypothetical protein UY3_08564 [Chelonia mydas]
MSNREAAQDPSGRSYDAMRDGEYEGETGERRNEQRDFETESWGKQQGQDDLTLQCHTMASMEPAQITAAVMSIVNNSRITLQYVQNQNLQRQARRRWQHSDESVEDVDTDFSQSTGPGNLDILVLMGQAHAVER